MSGEVVTIFDELRQHIRDVLDDTNGVWMDRLGFYYSECTKDFRDELDDKTIAQILKADNPRNAFEDHLQAAYDESMLSIENDVVEELRFNQNIARIMQNFNISEDDLRDFLHDVWYVNPPYEDFLKQDVCMDVMLDTGDANYEFTVNNLASSQIETVDHFDDNSSLLWLCEQQGVTREELLAAFDKGTAHSDEVCGLQQRSKELIADLQSFGFVLPRFAESVIHTGAYREFVKLQDALDKAQASIVSLKSKIEQNNISYQEYLKKHFDRYERLDPMTEEQFNAKRAEILASLDEKLATANSDFARAKDLLDFHKDYRQIAILQDEFKDVRRQLAELSKTDEYKKAEFINSIHNECVNTYGPSVVTFLVKMSLEEAIRLNEVIRAEGDINNSYDYEDRQGTSFLVLDKDVYCGLMDDCSGGGSVFGVQLIKDVQIPVKALYKAVPDRHNGNYGFMEIYGENDELFKPALKEIREEIAPRVSDLISQATGLQVATVGATLQNDIEMERG